MREKRSSSFYWLAALFGLFVLFLYGPMITIFILSFQGPDGGLTFPMNGVSLHWFAKLWEGLGVVDIWAAFRRSFRLGLVVMILTVVLSLAAGFAYRKRFRGADVLFYVVVASLIVPRSWFRSASGLNSASSTMPSNRWPRHLAGPMWRSTTRPPWASTRPASAPS